MSNTAAATQNHTVHTEAGHGRYAWVRKSRNGTIVAQSHRTWPRPGLARDNVALLFGPDAAPFKINDAIR
jgi:hypothetical protein